jgi:hypothetical protein
MKAKDVRVGGKYIDPHTRTVFIVSNIFHTQHYSVIILDCPNKQFSVTDSDGSREVMDWGYAQFEHIEHPLAIYNRDWVLYEPYIPSSYHTYVQFLQEWIWVS